MSAAGSTAPFLLVTVALSWSLSAFAANDDGAGDGQDALYVSQVSIATEGDLAPDAEIVRPGRALSINEAVALAIRNNLDVEVERFGPAIADANRDGAWGAYDPTLSANMGYDLQKTPNTFGLNPVASNRERVKGGGIGIDQLIPYVGARVGARYEAQSTSTRSGLQSLDEQFNSSFFLTATIPLARGLLWNQEWTNVQTSALGSDASFEGLRTAVMDTVRSTVESYWGLVAARDQVRVAQKSLETARALLEQTKTQYEVGVVSRVEVVEAEAGVADREFSMIRSANDYRNAQDTLIDAVLGRELGALTDLHFSPSDAPDDYQSRTVDVGRSVDLAFAQRPELAQQRKQIEQDEIELKFAKNQRLPQFDVEGRFGYVGISGEGNVGLIDLDPDDMLPPPIPPNRPFDRSDDDFFTGRGSENFRVQGTFSVPIPNTRARKQVVRSGLELQRAKTREARLEQSIILEVRRAARTLEASQQGIEAAERRRLAAEEQLRAERIRLEHGESTPFEVLQRESDLVEAESQKINALQSYRSAEVGLERAQGTILGAHSVNLDRNATLEYE
ncbi:MAG: TolC family protein [Myxococcota bacterium]